MRVPILLMANPEEKFWLTDERAASPTGEPVLIDAAGRVYYPADTPGLILVKTEICSVGFFNAVQKAGYQITWLD